MKRPFRFFWMTATVIFAIFTASSPLAAASSSYPEVTFILDASGSMLGKAGDKTKIEAAKAVLSQVVSNLSGEVKVGLVAYGHRRKGDCTDIEVLIPPGSDDRTALIGKVNALQPHGKTPITDAVTTVVDQLKTKDSETTIVLISDGIETCAADPCKSIRELKETGIKFIMHVVGFGVSEAENKQLDCLAKAGGGKYLTANDTQSLLDALNSVSKEIEKKVAVEKAKTVQVKAETGLGKIKLTMPESATKGMAGLKIIRVSDAKTVKEAGKLSAESMHPMPAGTYEIEYLFASPNYGAPTVTKLGSITLSGGETKEIAMGAVVFNIADPLKDKVPVQQVIIAESGSDKPVVVVNDNSNGYYNFVPKAVLPGKYDIFIHYSHSPSPTKVSAGVIVKPKAETVVTLDSGIVFKEVKGTDISGWDLIPLTFQRTADTMEDEEVPASTQPLLQARPPSGNKTTLWKPYIVPEGNYRLVAHVKGMDEPLPVAEALEIRKGQTLDFDSGL
jgi:Ca-activated chloride channel family protein